MRYLGIAAIAVLVSGCASIDQGLMAVTDQVSSVDPVTGERQVNLVPEEQEIKEASDTADNILAEAKSNGVKTDGQIPQYAQVIRVFDRLKAVTHRKELPWEIHVLNVDDWNAFTIGGGKIFILSGIFAGDAALKTDDELAVVIAHEMAHVSARHSSEKGAKIALMKGASKKLKRDQGFEASFTTNQEDEADRYGALYMALAGFDPRVGEQVWKKLHAATGSYTGDMQYDHPLSDDRSRNIANYASLVEKYHVSGAVNPRHEEILKSNELYRYKAPSSAKAGSGGGLAALLEVAANSYLEAESAKQEEQKRLLKQAQQEQEAANRVRFEAIKIAATQEGGNGLFGICANTSGSEIIQSVVAIEYLKNGVVLARDDVPWHQMKIGERIEFGVRLAEVQYDAVSIRAVYVRTSGE